MPKRSNVFSEFFPSTPDEWKPVVTELRRLVEATAPALKEEKRYGMPQYTLGGPTVVYIMPASDHVNLGFYDGVDLKDPKKRLEGSGKRLRHVKVHSVHEAKDPALRALLEEALAFRGREGPPKRSR